MDIERLNENGCEHDRLAEGESDCGSSPWPAPRPATWTGRRRTLGRRRLPSSATDLIVFHAEALVTLGDVLRAAGRISEADVAFGQALDLYRQKGSLVG